MRKRIAVFVNGWGNDYLQQVVQGVSRRATQENIDIFLFVNYTAIAENQEYNVCELNIFRLPDLKDFDGVILMTNSFNLQEETDYLRQKLAEYPLPAVSLEYELEGIDSIISDNYFGMYELTEHMIQVHHVKQILFIGGPKEHQESNIRLKAVLDAAGENGITLRQEDILYSDWARELVKSQVKQWIDENHKLPEAIICANDVMATSLCEWLLEQGYRIPEDIRVTGYDCIPVSQDFEPVITTVTHRWQEMGELALGCILDKIAGRKSTTPGMLKTALVCGESCGCQITDGSFEKSISGRMTKRNKADAVKADSHFRHIYMAVRKVETAKELSESLSNLYEREHWMVGGNFMLCLEPQFFHIEEDDMNLGSQGYSDTVDVICSLKDGVPREHELLDRREVMYRVSNENKEPGTYIFVPIHTEGRTLGFAMLTCDIDIAEHNYLYIWTRHINQYMEQVRRNIKLAELTKRLTQLSVTDVLTGVYNRAGCEKIIYPYLQECQQTGGQGIVMIVDVDRMKTVNDKYGHGNGDLALRMVSGVLKTQLPEDFLVARFGGDEFFVAGRSKEGISVDGIIERVTKQLAEEVKKQEIPFELTMSMGGIQMEKGETFSLEKCLQRADENMYTMKEKRHAQIDNPSVRVD